LTEGSPTRVGEQGAHRWGDTLQGRSNCNTSGESPV
jgi:hypothetical protein